MIEWVGSGNPSTTLHHIVALSGTADKDDFFALHVNPGKTLVSEVAIVEYSIVQIPRSQDPLV